MRVFEASRARYNDRVTPLTEIKRELRAGIRADRLAMSEDRRASARAGLTARLIDLARTREARSFSCFLPTRSEPDTRGFLEWAEAQALEMLLPSSRADGTLDWIRPSGEGTVRGAHGIDEPIGKVVDPRAVENVELMLIPAAAVDLRGNRLGWGRGYFDRTLSSMARRPDVFAVVFDHEVLDRLPAESHDVPITGVVTPLRTVVF